MAEADRRRLGAYYTPADTAARLVGVAFRHAELGPGELPERVCDPSCGAGSILLAVADELLARGATPSEVIGQHLVGCDIDPVAAERARRSLHAWALEAGEADPPEPRIIEADALALPDGFPNVDMVVGNPPFASPLRADAAVRRAQRLSEPAPSSQLSTGSGPDGAYVDESALHLRAAVELVSPGGVVCLLQPQSLLGSRDAAGIRSAVAARAELVGLWASGQDLFEHATVRVCAPVLLRNRQPEPTGARTTQEVTVHWEDSPELRVLLEADGPWSLLLARAMGTPALRAVGHPGAAASAAGSPGAGSSGPRSPNGDVVRVGDLARCTAGFREEFYSLAAAAVESQGSGPEPDSGESHRLVTVGMIDPGVLRWGVGSWRLGGGRFTAPMASAQALAGVSARVGAWSTARAVPKVMVASQTKVLEAVVDRRGEYVPVTPVVSVEPSGDCSPVALAAMLSAPCNSARLATRAAGTGRNSTALRVGASAVVELAVSSDPHVWRSAELLWGSFEELARATASPGEWFDMGAELDRLLGVEPDAPAISWWVERLPRRLVATTHLT